MTIASSDAERNFRAGIEQLITHITANHTNSLTAKYLKAMDKKEAVDFLIQNFNHFQPYGDASPLHLTYDQFAVLREIAFAQDRRTFLKKAAFVTMAATAINHHARNNDMGEIEKNVNTTIFLVSTGLAIHINRDGFNEELQKLLMLGDQTVKGWFGKDINTQKMAFNVVETLDPLLKNLCKQILRDESEVKRTL